jgi:hypothetical protein
MGTAGGAEAGGAAARLAFGRTDRGRPGEAKAALPVRVAALDPAGGFTLLR